MEETGPCLKRIVHEKVEYSHTEGHADVFVCTCCGKEFEEKMDSSG